MLFSGGIALCNLDLLVATGYWILGISSSSSSDCPLALPSESGDWGDGGGIESSSSET